MRAVVAVIGKDTVGILAKVCGICAEHNANVMDVTQTIMQDLFAMTPYYWNTPADGAARLAACESLTTEIGFRFLVYKKE